MIETTDTTGPTDTPESGDDQMILMDHVSKWYGDFQVLTNCTTSVKTAEVLVVCVP